MSPFRLAFALLRIPRLFAALILFPLLLSLLIVFAQLVLTTAASRFAAVDSSALEQHYERRRESDLGKLLVLGDTALAPLQICRWNEVPTSEGLREVPPGPQCAPDRLDAALHVASPHDFDAKDYVRLLDGWVERLHVCKSCRPDIVISIAEDSIRSDVYSTQALILLQLSRNNQSVQEHFIAATRERDQLRALTGETHFHSVGLRSSINLDQSKRMLTVIVNVAGLVIVALWLALKSHRKVLDYFAKNGALLPMVAATGKRSFYGALWVLTILRVSAFLAAAVPLTLYGIHELLDSSEDIPVLFPERAELVLWLIALTSSFALAALIASLADLRHRHELLSVLYRYVPLGFCMLGTALWTATFIFDGPLFGTIRSGITALPILGMGPILVAPALKPELSVLVVHGVLTLILLGFAVRANTRWFAAHLDEL